MTPGVAARDVVHPMSEQEADIFSCVEWLLLKIWKKESRNRVRDSDCDSLDGPREVPST